MISCDLSESRSNLSVGVKTSLVHKTVESFASENGFDFAEHSFNGVEFWRITHIVNALNMEAWPPLAQFFGLVHSSLDLCTGNESMNKVTGWLPCLLRSFLRYSRKASASMA